MHETFGPTEILIQGRVGEVFGCISFIQSIKPLSGSCTFKLISTLYELGIIAWLWLYSNQVTNVDQVACMFNHSFCNNKAHKSLRNEFTEFLERFCNFFQESPLCSLSKGALVLLEKLNECKVSQRSYLVSTSPSSIPIMSSLRRMIFVVRVIDVYKGEFGVGLPYATTYANYALNDDPIVFVGFLGTDDTSVA
ncbi:hypothetical protein VNO77_34210 [Canavalia gladiata]|uniref:Uncharacterized protein n=1 Tax=Canavalia gladiata TaxID=3824 RepID=A0AAN9KEP3_CANGL